MTAPPDRSLRRTDAPDVPATSPAPSKSRRKKDMHALQDLGALLVGLEPSKLKALDLPERLADAIAQARSITKHEGRRRQLQFVGRLMRDVDPEPIRAALERMQTLPRAERAQFAAAERWRDRLLTEELAVAEFIAAHPDVDPDALAELVREARGERASGRPPHKFRALFRLVSQCIAR
jgi:ribosome-associated protein